MPLIQDCTFTAIDFESAGVARGSTEVPVQVGLASWSVARGHHGQFVSYLHSGQPIQWSARKVHGIGPEDLAGAPTLLSLWPVLKEHLAGHVVVAHGKGTEQRFLRVFPGHGFGPWLDTLPLSRALWPSVAGHKLGPLCESLGVASVAAELVAGRSWHDALFDAVASLAVLEKAVADASLAERELDLILQPNTAVWHNLRR